MAEAKAKRKLQELSQRWYQKNITVDQILGIYKNSDKYTVERQSSLLKQMFKPHISDFDKHLVQWEADVKKNKRTPYDAFIVFVNNMTMTTKPQIPQKPSLDTKSSSKSEFESPVLSSTRVESSYKPEVVVSEVKFDSNCAIYEE